MALKTDGRLWTWGQNRKGALGINVSGADWGDPGGTRRSSPTQVPGTTWSKIIASQNGGRAVKTDGTLWSWGDNIYGELGLNQGGDPGTLQSSPAQIPGTTWDSVGIGARYSGFATRTDGTMWAWGENTYGVQGRNIQGSPTRSSSPAQVPGSWHKAADWDKSAISLFWKAYDG